MKAPLITKENGPSGFRKRWNFSSLLLSHPELPISSRWKRGGAPTGDLPGDPQQRRHCRDGKLKMRCPRERSQQEQWIACIKQDRNPCREIIVRQAPIAEQHKRGRKNDQIVDRQMR